MTAGTSLTIKTGEDSGAVASATPRKLRMDEDDEDVSLIHGGPFENAKRKNSWSATTMRKELGSPRIVSNGVGVASAGFEFDDTQSIEEEPVAPSGGVSARKHKD